MVLSIDILYVRLFIRLLLGLILLSMSLAKLAHLHKFRQGIQEYQVIPFSLESKMHFSSVLSICIPIAELLAGLGLISGVFLAYAVLLAFIFIVIFSLAIIANLIRKRTDLSCHCSGILGSHSISWWLVGRNTLFIAVLLALFITPADPFTLETFISNPSFLGNTLLSTIIPVALLVGVGLAIGALFNSARVLLHPSLFRKE